MTSLARILIVEDDPDQAMLFTQALSRAGYQAETVPMAETALNALASVPVDLLLADWELPAMKGDRLISITRTQQPKIRTLLMSNHAHVREVAKACGADRWFRKCDGVLCLRTLVKEMLP